MTSLKHHIPGLPEEEVEDLLFYRTDPGSLWLSKLPLLSQWQVIETLARRIEEVIEREKPDIIQAHSPALNGLAALKAAKKFDLPVVYECRAFWEDAAVDHGTSRDQGLRYRLSRALETRVFRSADAVTTICEGLKSDIVQRGIPAPKVTVIPNAVDVEHFQSRPSINRELADRLELRDKTVLGFIGSFYAYEGIPLLLESFRRLRPLYPELRLLLVGGGPQENLIRRQVSGFNLEDSVVMPGRVSHGEVQEFYTLVDIFVYPRLSMRLTDLVTPLKPLEAMASGKLVVASDVGGHRELIAHGSTGTLFRADSAESLTSAIADLLDNRSNWHEFRCRGRAFVENERNWRNSIARYQAIYQQLCQ